jgi:hypothetical protein
MKIQSTAILMLGLILLVTGCSEGGSVSENTTPETPEPPELTERVALLMGGWPHAKAITETGKATALRIGRDDDFNETYLSEEIELTAEQRQTLVELLARDDAYLWDSAKGCEPMNGVLLRFTDGATYARVRFCFSCQIVEYRPGSSEDFDPINDELVEWVKGVFPDDEAIQSLGTADEASGL